MGLVQSAHNTATSGSSVAATFGSGTTSGNTIIPMVNNLAIPTLRTVSSIALTGGSDTFTKAVSVSVSDNDSEIWSDIGCSAGHTVVTATFSGAINDASIDIIEWNGVTGSAADKTNSGSNSSSGTWTSNATGTLTQASEVAFGTVLATAVSAVTVTAPGSPWNNLTQDSPASTYVAQSGYQQVSSTASLAYSGTDTPSTSTWTACIATFKLSGAAPVASMLLGVFP